MKGRHPPLSHPFLGSELPLERIVSGGQTGVDRAALDVAIELDIPHGGWCPRGRKAEDGEIPLCYQLREMPTDVYSDRTRQNVVDSDGTLILFRDRLEGGTLLTSRLARELGKPFHRVRLGGRVSYLACMDWLIAEEIRVLNVAGPRSSKDPKIYERAVRFLRQLLASPSQ